MVHFDSLDSSFDLQEILREEKAFQTKLVCSFCSVFVQIFVVFAAKQ